MILLSTASVGRDNNFNLLRFFAATLVLISHAWPIALGAGAPEPLHWLLGISLGSIAVIAFFAISGFFITASFARSRSAKVFLIARSFRLFPCLAVSLFLVAFVMGPIVTTLPIKDYFFHSETQSFIVRNLVLASPQYTLPGVFKDNPYPTVEGSIWTLFYEVLCYMIVFIAGLVGVLWSRLTMLVILCCYLTLWFLPEALDLKVHYRILQFRDLSLPFLFGVSFWIWKEYVLLSFKVVVGLFLFFILSRETAFEPLILAFWVSYSVFWAGHAPGKLFRKFNELGDYSYGIYIYAFPIQGLVVWIGFPMTPLENIMWSLPLTVFFAVVSWHAIELPALRLAKKYDNSVRAAD